MSEPSSSARPVWLSRAQFSCGHYRALTAEEAGKESTQIGADLYCLVCTIRRQVVRREAL